MQGKNVSERTNAVAKVTRDAAAAARFHELISSFKMVVSGAMLTCNAAVIFPPMPMNMKLKYFKVIDFVGLHNGALEKDNKDKAPVSASGAEGNRRDGRAWIHL